MNPVLIVASTRGEISPLLHALNPDQIREGKEGIIHLDPLSADLLITGVGMANAALALGACLGSHKPEFALQVGIAGAFRRSGLKLGDVAEVRENIFPEMGAESPQGFLGMKELGFPLFEEDEKQFFNQLQNPWPAKTLLKPCREITVNKVHGEESSIFEIERAWHPDTETMEGAAFFLACLKYGIPFCELRGISNFVEPRNREEWKIKEAVKAVNDEVLKLLKSDRL